jgi:hypothetical protein
LVLGEEERRGGVVSLSEQATEMRSERVREGEVGERVAAGGQRESQICGLERKKQGWA